jgi:hypothetical protein
MLEPVSAFDHADAPLARGTVIFFMMRSAPDLAEVEKRTAIAPSAPITASTPK